MDEYGTARKKSSQQPAPLVGAITPTPSTPTKNSPSEPKPAKEFLLPEKEDKKKTPPKKKHSQSAVNVGKSVSVALKDNIAHTMATTFADQIIALTDQNYKSAIKKKLEERESEDDEEAHSNNSQNDLVNDIVEGKDTFVGSGKRRAAVPKKCCCTKMTLWLSSAEDAFKSFADFISKLQISSDGKKTLKSLYREDIRKTVEAVMNRQDLFDNSSPVAKGLARFDMHIDLLPSDRISVLDSSIAVETNATLKGNPLNTLSTFKDEVKELLCPRVKNLLKHLSPDWAASVFNDIVKYVEKKNSVSFYKLWGDLPGTEFRILLADINIKIMERTLSKSTSEDFFGPASSSTPASCSTALNLNEEDTRTMINALQKIREWKPVSKDYPSRIDKARDVVLIPETGNISRIPVTPTDLLQLVFYINALLSLERRNVFTSGFFNAACVLISQCLSASPCNTSNSLIRPSKLAAKIARDNLLSLHVIKNSNDVSLQTEKKQKTKKEEEPMSVDEESSSASSSSLSEDDARQRKRKKKTKKSDSISEEKATALRDLIYETGGFFHDTSEFGKKIKRLIDSKDHIGLIKYASTLIDHGSKIHVQRLVANLVDILILKTEQCEDLKKSCSCPSYEKNIATTESKLEIAKMLFNPQANKNEMAEYFLTGLSIVPKHEVYVLTERLLPSDNNNDTGTVVLSFFRDKKNIDDDAVENPTCPELNNLPNLLKFSKELLSEITKIIVPVLNNKVSESTSQQMNVDTFLKYFSPLGPKLNIPARIKSAVIVTDNGRSTRILFSPVQEINTTAGLKLRSLVKVVINSPQMENIRQNAADLHDPDNAALSMILFPPSSKEDNNDEITVLSKLAKGLFSIAEGSMDVVRSGDFDEESDVRSSYVLVLDVNTMDKAVKFAASTLENAMAKALYTNEDMRPSKVLEGASFVEGVFSHMLDRRENINTNPNECPKPTSLAKYMMTDVTSRYLKRLKKREKGVFDYRTTDTAATREEDASDRALVEEVTNRATDIVNAQMANAMGVAIIMSATIKILDSDAEEAEARSTNNQTTPLENYHTTRTNVLKRIGVIRNLAHLCITTAAAAASNMTKLSNQHFFDLIREANATMTKKITATNEESESYRDKEIKKAMLLGYTNKPEDFYLHKHGNSSKDGEKRGGTTSLTGDWLYNAIKSITERRKGENENITATAPSKFLLFNDSIISNNRRWSKETQESIMDKLNGMVKGRSEYL